MLGQYLGSSPSTTKLLLHLNGNSNDSSGNGNNGTDTNITYSQANGKFGMGAGFNGSSSKIAIGSPVINSGTTMTFSCFVKSSNFSQAHDVTILSNQTDLNNYGFVFSNFTNYVNNWNVFYGNGAGNWRGIGVNTFPLKNNVWTNVIATINGNVLTVYINGQQFSQATYNTVNFTNASNLHIGVNPAGSANRYFNGIVDEVIIENVAWSAEKVKKYYTMTKGRFGIL